MKKLITLTVILTTFIGYTAEYRTAVYSSGSVVLTPTYAGATKAQTVEAEHTAPVVRIDNTTEEDGEGGRAATVIFSGERSGGEAVDSAKIIGSHSGTDDDDKGKLQIQVNSGSGLATAVTILDTGYLGVGTTSPSAPVTVSGTIDSAFLRIGADSYLGVGKWMGIGMGYLSTSMKTAIIVECTDATYARGTLHFCNNNEANTNNVSLSDSKAYITAAGDAWFIGDVSALTFTDRTPYPETTQQAYDAIATMERLPDGEYEVGNKDKQLKHANLHSFIKADKVVKDDEGNDVVINGRDLSATVSCLVEIIKDQKARIEALEEKTKDK